ncbi:MAG TPA: glycosyl hydrolase family 28-related protein, partial [Jiangellales bacterium]|nr:glycosyl hydrolase family 28-related protein [Jiangellales bacterium]
MDEEIANRQVARRRLLRRAGTVAATVVGAGTVPAVLASPASADPGKRTRPPSAVHSHTIANVSGLQDALDELAEFNTINVRNFGAVGDGVADDTAAFQDAVAAAKASARTIPQSLWPDQFGTVVIEVPPGDYRLTASLLGPENMTSKLVGLKIKGAGDGISNIIFDPSTSGNLCQNDYWQNLQFEGLGFFAATPGCTFMFTSTKHNAQRYQFLSCSFHYWRHGFRLEGSNNNSEYFFMNCHTSHIESDGAFLYVGDTNTSDQFLNYWFYGCTHWSTSAPFIDAAFGGHFHINGLDVSDWGVDLSSTGHLFVLRGASHALGTCVFEANGVRVEAKNNAAALLYSEWPQGSVALRSVDWSSQAFAHTYGDIIHIRYTNVGGATYSFSECDLAGGVKVSFAVNEWAYRHRISFNDCTWYQRSSPYAVVSYDTSAAGGNDRPTPPVEFRGCRGENGNVFAAAGAAVWDATIGYRGQLLQALQPRVVSVRSVYGMPRDLDDPVRLILPVGALVTGFEVLSPAGVVTEGDGGTWSLSTAETVPTTVAAATVTSAMAAGFTVSATMPLPFHCDTLARATLTVEATGVDQHNWA